MSGPSRSAERNAGWGCARPGAYRQLVPRSARRLYWARPGPLLASRNDLVARRFGDPTDDMRRAWVDRMAAPDLTVRRFADRDRVSVALLGDPGEGDASQYILVPVLERVAGGTDFGVVVSDVVYPAGGIRTYLERFYLPYADYPAPLYALPGNHDWYDGLTGFMTAFCDVPPYVGAPTVRGPGPAPARLLRRLLWRRAPKATVEQVADMRWLRDEERQQGGQPGPYCAIDAGPVLLVLVDTGVRGRIDRGQGAWLRAVSAGSPKPKILLTGTPLYTYGARQACPIEGGGDVNEIVTDPRYGYVAAIGGDDHNYQRYPVRLRDGRTVLYVVAGGSGAYLSATHQIPNVDALAPACFEEDFRCYPLRGDSLAHFSTRYDRLLRFGTGRLRISPTDAVTIMARRVGIEPPRAGTHWADVSERAKRAARRIFPLPARGSAPAHNLQSWFFDSDTPPMFKSVLRLDATADEFVLSCFAATGCGEHEAEPVLEDRMRARPDARGVWRWTSETPGRARP